ncbi:MAG: leucine-rich repeat protein, partial [Clostridia bacterium]|nr:leucine-rich repeat protein [Clostridia bacterium]
YEAMCGNPRLKTVSVAGVTDAGEGIYDFRNITNLGWGDKSLLGNADARYVPEGIEVWLGASTGVPDASKNWYWFGALASEGVQPAAKVIIKVVSGSDAATKVLSKVQQQKGENPDPNMAANIEIAYFLPPTNGTDETYGYYSWDFDTKTGTLTFTRLKEGWAELYFPHGGITAWIDAYRDQIKHIVIPNFSQYSDSRGLYPFSNLPNLETVKFDTKQIANGGGKDGKGMFYNCPMLKTFGASQSFEEGVIDLSNITFTTIDENVYLKNMFYGCESIEKVLWNNIKFMKSEVEVPFVIGASMFENCTNLRSVDISGATAIHSAAFKNCSSLGGTVLYSGDANIGDAFYGCGGVVISTDSTEKISAMLASMQNAGVSIKNAMVSCMSHGGFAVRTKDYNGLRSFYSFVGETNVDFDNLTLVEYGSIVGAAENYELYSKDIGGEGFIFTLEGNEFKTPTGIVKTAIYIAEGYTGDIAKHKTVNENGTVDFVVTVTNFAPVQYNRNVIMNGYEIWEDTEGNYYLIITEYPYDDYKVNSLYKTTMGMLIDGVIEMGEENTPVNDVVNSVSKTVFDCGNENVTSFLIPHHLKAGKKIAVYSTDSEETIELNDLGIPAEELPYVADYAFSGNITCKLPKIDDYWMEHINEQLATLPEGKSFIAITDTHYESGGRGNIGKSADLMQYVRKTSGISKVVNLGDPFHQENTYEGALKQLSRSMEEKFFDYFGDDGIYAIGNHDSNITIARTIDDDDPGTYKMDILLTDKDIYNRTVAHVAAGGEKNGNVIFNEELIEIIKANKDDIGAFVLDNVAPENSVNSKFGNVNYSAEEMYENLLCWAKLHYAYYDHDAKICYIVLNTGGLTLTDFATLNLELWKFNPCQYNFVAKILNQVSENYSDYDIVVAGHMLYNSEYPDSAGNGDLFRMLSAFEAGTSVSFTASGNNALSGKLFGCTDGSTSRTLSYDFTENDFTGEIICISGHWHVDLQTISQTENGAYIYNSDYNTTSADSADSLPLFVLNQDNAREKMSDAEPDTQVPVVGTITEQCFTIFTITEDNKIVITRIGANSGWLQKTFDMK